MKTFLSLLSLFASAALLTAGVENGETAPDFTLQTPEGKSVSLSDYKGETVVLEWVNPGCPFVVKFYQPGVMQMYQAQAKSMDVVWLTINSTNPDHRDYLNPEESLAWAGKHNVVSTWLLDSDGEVGRAYGARTTPHMFIINPEGKVVYQGAIDSIRSTDSSDIDAATNYVMANLKAMKAGEALVETRSRPYGCSVKY